MLRAGAHDDEARAHPHNVARGTFVDVDGAPQPAPAPRFSRTPSAVERTPVVPGTDTDAALADWGFDAATIAELREHGRGRRDRPDGDRLREPLERPATRRLERERRVRSRRRGLLDCGSVTSTSPGTARSAMRDARLTTEP